MGGEIDNKPTDIDELLAGALGGLESKLLAYLESNVKPLVERVKALETPREEQPKPPASLEARLAQLEGEIAKRDAEAAEKATQESLRAEIGNGLSGYDLDEREFVLDTLYKNISGEAEQTPTGWLMKDGSTVTERVTDFLQKGVGKRFIKVSTAPGSGTPEPKVTTTSTGSTLADIVTNTLW